MIFVSNFLQTGGGGGGEQKTIMQQKDRVSRSNSNRSIGIVKAASTTTTKSSSTYSSLLSSSQNLYNRTNNTNKTPTPFKPHAGLYLIDTTSSTLQSRSTKNKQQLLYHHHSRDGAIDENTHPMNRSFQNNNNSDSTGSSDFYSPISMSFFQKKNHTTNTHQATSISSVKKKVPTPRGGFFRNAFGTNSNNLATNYNNNRTDNNNTNNCSTNDKLPIVQDTSWIGARLSPIACLDDESDHHSEDEELSEIDYTSSKAFFRPVSTRTAQEETKANQRQHTQSVVPNPDHYFQYIYNPESNHTSSAKTPTTTSVTTTRSSQQRWNNNHENAKSATSMASMNSGRTAKLGNVTSRSSSMNTWMTATDPKTTFSTKTTTSDENTYLLINQKPHQQATTVSTTRNMNQIINASVTKAKKVKTAVTPATKNLMPHDWSDLNEYHANTYHNWRQQEQAQQQIRQQQQLEEEQLNLRLSNRTGSKETEPTTISSNNERYDQSTSSNSTTNTTVSSPRRRKGTYREKSRGNNNNNSNNKRPIRSPSFLWQSRISQQSDYNTRKKLLYLSWGNFVCITSMFYIVCMGLYDYYTWYQLYQTQQVQQHDYDAAGLDYAITYLNQHNNYNYYNNIPEYSTVRSTATNSTSSNTSDSNNSTNQNNSFNWTRYVFGNISPSFFYSWKTQQETMANSTTTTMKSQQKQSRQQRRNRYMSSFYYNASSTATGSQSSSVASTTNSNSSSMPVVTITEQMLEHHTWKFPMGLPPIDTMILFGAFSPEQTRLFLQARTSSSSGATTSSNNKNRNETITTTTKGIGLIHFFVYVWTCFTFWSLIGLQTIPSFFMCSSIAEWLVVVIGWNQIISNLLFLRRTKIKKKLETKATRIAAAALTPTTPIGINPNFFVRGDSWDSSNSGSIVPGMYEPLHFGGGNGNVATPTAATGPNNNNNIKKDALLSSKSWICVINTTVIYVCACTTGILWTLAFDCHLLLLDIDDSSSSSSSSSTSSSSNDTTTVWYNATGCVAWGTCGVLCVLASLNHNYLLATSPATTGREESELPSYPPIITMTTTGTSYITEEDGTTDVDRHNDHHFLQSQKRKEINELRDTAYTNRTIFLGLSKVLILLSFFQQRASVVSHHGGSSVIGIASCSFWGWIVGNMLTVYHQQNVYHHHRKHDDNESEEDDDDEDKEFLNCCLLFRYKLKCLIHTGPYLSLLALLWILPIVNLSMYGSTSSRGTELLTE